MKANVLKAMRLPSRLCDDHLSSKIEELFPELYGLQTTNNLKLEILKMEEGKERIKLISQEEAPFYKIGSKCNCAESLVENVTTYEITICEKDCLFLPPYLEVWSCSSP